MEDKIVLRVVARFVIPFILLYALYVQLHGEYSPGGGFQAGVIFASAFFLYALIFGVKHTLRLMPLWAVRTIACLGVLTYGMVGIVSMLKGGNFLGYSALASNPTVGQQLGIMTIEIGVGMTVFSVMLLIIYLFIEREEV